MLLLEPRAWSCRFNWKFVYIQHSPGCFGSHTHVVFTHDKSESYLRSFVHFGELRGLTRFSSCFDHRASAVPRIRGNSPSDSPAKPNSACIISKIYVFRRSHRYVRKIFRLRLPIRTWRVAQDGAPYSHETIHCRPWWCDWPITKIFRMHLHTDGSLHVAAYSNCVNFVVYKMLSAQPKKYKICF